MPRIHEPNSAAASGPAFSLDVTIPSANLPVYLINYKTQCSQGCRDGVDDGGGRLAHTVSMKPSSMSTRVLQFQGRLHLSANHPEYSILYTFDPYEDGFQTYADALVYAPSASGTFSVEHDTRVYNASDYWTYDVLNRYQIRLTFQPSIGMVVSRHGRSLWFDIVF